MTAFSRLGVGEFPLDETLMESSKATLQDSVRFKASVSLHEAYLRLFGDRVLIVVRVIEC